MQFHEPTVPEERIAQRIFLIWGEKVIIDADLADFFGTTTKRLNEQVKRNSKRFPSDFMFRLTKEEAKELVAHCDHLGSLKYSSALPCAFTEHGFPDGGKRAELTPGSCRQRNCCQGLRQTETVCCDTKENSGAATVARAAP